MSPLQGEQRPKLWERTFPWDVLAVVNADSNRVTVQAPGGEAVSTLNHVAVGSDSGTFQVLGSPHGVLLLAVNDKSPYVQLVALDVVTGGKLWQVACTGLPVADLPELPEWRANRVVSDFLTTRSQVIAVQQSDNGKMLVAYDIRTGVELWRSAAGGFDLSEMLKQMTAAMPKATGRAGRIMKGTMAQFQSVAFSYYMLPQRNLLVKVYSDPAGVVWEAVDLDTGESGWSLHFPPVDSGKPMVGVASKLATKNAAKTAAKKMQQEDTTTLAGGMIGRSFRGELFIEGCTGLAEALRELRSGTCPPLKVYSVATGQLAWELREAEVRGWLAATDTVLVRLPQKIAALKLSTGEKLYEISDNRVAAIDSGFNSLSSYSDGDWIFWFDRKDKSKSLVALDTRTETVPWQAPIPNEKVVGFLVWERVLVVATTTEIILVDKASGRVVGREKPLGGAEIRAASPLDARSMLVVGDAQIRRFEVDPWRQVYATHIPQQGSSAFSQIFVLALAAAMSQVRVPMMGPGPGTFVQVPYWRTPRGMETTYRLLAHLDSPALMKLEQRSAHYMYFNSGDAIHRVDVLTGKREDVASAPKKNSTFAIDESRGLGCLIRNGTLTAYQIPMDDTARRAAQYGDGMEIGFSESRRAEKLEASDKAKAAAAYLSAVKGFSSGLAAGEEGQEKAVLHLALGQVYDRLSVVLTQETESWKEKAVQEYKTAASVTCNGPAGGLEGLCRTAAELLQARNPQ
jgi:outer membrane protein assembly factor BamB